MSVKYINVLYDIQVYINVSNNNCSRWSLRFISPAGPRRFLINAVATVTSWLLLRDIVDTAFVFIDRNGARRVSPARFEGERINARIFLPSAETKSHAKKRHFCIRCRPIPRWTFRNAVVSSRWTTPFASRSRSVLSGILTFLLIVLNDCACILVQKKKK